ncbi:MAG TPA: hypothetical protein VFA99_18525 [Acidobacteriaceae bacterium]|nr:hypothetical protein [Acidobacteriaceae bacterium]
MRRLLSILLLAAFALPLVAPALALAQDPDAGLPACCRRHGRHHCAMLERQKDPSAHQVGAVCPAWPQRAVPAWVVSHPFLGRVPRSGVSLDRIIVTAATLDAHPLQTGERLHPKRGPPTESLPFA